MRYRILTTNGILNDLRKETSALINSTKSKKENFDENDPFGTMKRRKTKAVKYPYDEPFRTWVLRRHDNTLLAICGSRRIAEAIEEDFTSRHCFDDQPRRSFKEAMSEWWAATHPLEFAEAPIKPIEAKTKKVDVERLALDYFYDTSPKSVKLGESMFVDNMAKSLYDHYLHESVKNGYFDAVASKRLVSRKMPVSIRMNDTDVIVCVF